MNSHPALPVLLRTLSSVPRDRSPCQGHERRGRVELHFIFQSLISRKMMAELLLKILRKGSSVTKLEIQKRGEKLRGSRGCHSETILPLPHTGRDLSHRLQHSGPAGPTSCQCQVGDPHRNSPSDSTPLCSPPPNAGWPGNLEQK